MSQMPRTGLYPFPYKITGTANKPIINEVPAVSKDSLYGYAVNLYDNPVVRMKVKCSKPTNVRVDLIDKNRRVSNTVAPHHWINTADSFVDLEFRWDQLKVDGSKGWMYEDPYTDEYNVGCAADGWASPWWGVDAGRTKESTPLLGGRNAWRGAIMLDLKNIVGIAITMEDGSISADYSGKTGGNTATKTLTIKELIVGDNSKFVNLTASEIKNPTSSSTNTTATSKIVSLTPNTIAQGETQTIKVVATGKPFANGVGSVSLNSSYYYSLDVLSTTKINDSIATIQIKAYSYSPTGFYNLVLGDLKLLDAISVYTKPILEPVYKSISPASITQGQALTVSLSVANANFTQNAPYSIYFQQASSTVFYSDAVTVVDDQTVSLKIGASYALPAGKYDVYFSYYQNNNYYRSVYAMGAFSVKESIVKPVLNDLSVTSGLQGTSLSVSLSGTNCNFSQISSTYDRNVIMTNANGYQISIPYYQIQVVSDSELKLSVSIPRDAPTGAYSVALTERTNNYLSYNYNVLKDAFTVDYNAKLPRLIKIESAYAQQGEHLTVTLSGHNTNFSQQSATYLTFTQASNSTRTHQLSNQFNSVTTTVVSPTQVSVELMIPRMANLGYYDVSMYVNGETLSLVRGFVITENPNRPKIVSVSKTEAKQGETLEVTITAKDINFKAASSSVEVVIGSAWAYTEASSVRVVDANNIVATFRIPDNMPVGASPVYVVNNIYTANLYRGNSEYYIAPQTIMINESAKTAEEITIPVEVLAENEQKSLGELSLYPSTTLGSFTLVSPIAAKVEIIDLTGNVIAPITSIEVGAAQFDISNLSAGIYKVIVRSETGTKTLSIIKQ